MITVSKGMIFAPCSVSCRSRQWQMVSAAQ